MGAGGGDLLALQIQEGEAKAGVHPGPARHPRPKAHDPVGRSTVETGRRVTRSWPSRCDKGDDEVDAQLLL